MLCSSATLRKASFKGFVARNESYCNSLQLNLLQSSQFGFDEAMEARVTTQL